MKIAFVYDAVYPWVKGGGEKRIFELARRLVLRGHEVHWYSWGWWLAEEGEHEIVMEGINLHSIGAPIPLYVNGRRSIKEAIFFALKLIPHLFKQNFDVVDCQGFPFFSCFSVKLHSITGKSRMIITLLEVWGDYWYTYLGSMGIFGKLLEKLTLYLSNQIICISEKTEKDLEELRKIQGLVIPPGIDFQEIQKVPPQQGKWDLIYAGRLIKEKRVDLLLQAISYMKNDHPEIKCIIIGDGPEMDALKNLANDLDLKNNIEFTGFLENVPDLLSYIKSSQVFILPSEREGFGMVVVEANACGVPVVVVESSMNAAVDLVHEGENGFVADPGYEDMALKITYALNQKDDMYDNCMDYARDFDWDNIVPRLEEHYQSQLNSK